MKIDISVAEFVAFVELIQKPHDIERSIENANDNKKEEKTVLVNACSVTGNSVPSKTF